MGSPSIEYLNYASPPLGEGAQALRAKLYRPDIDAPPLFVWFQRGGFREGSIDSPGMDRIARVMMRQGYAAAFVETRLNAKATDLLPVTQAELPALLEEAALAAPDLPAAYTGAPALAAMEDGAAFLAWIARNRDALGLGMRIMLGGNASGGTTVLNILNLAPTLGLELPEIATAVTVSGGYAYPSRRAAGETQILALHGSADDTIPPSVMRAYAYLAGARCLLIESPKLSHGDLRLTETELQRHAISRFAAFDRGVLPDLAEIGATLVQPRRDHRVCLVTSLKAEAPFLLEWVAHHRALGVSDIVVFSSPSDDGTEEMLDALHDRGLIIHIPNPAADLGSADHRRVMRALSPQVRVCRTADYVLEADVTEFLEIDAADGTLDGLLAVTDAPDRLALAEWRFGFGGVAVFDNRLITSQFRQSQPVDPERRRHVMARPGAAGASVLVDPVLARVNAYPLRAAESFLTRLRPGQTLPRRYLAVCNGDAMVHAPSRSLPRLKLELTSLLADPELLRLHRGAVASHRARIDARIADPAFADTWAEITRIALGAPPAAARIAAE